jgi:hypothetical protein
MPRGIRIKNYPLKKSTDPKDKKRAKSARKSYERYKAGLTPAGAKAFGKTKKPKTKEPRTKLKKSTIKLNMKKIGLDIKKAKQACRWEINNAKANLKDLVTKYSELVSLEKLMREVTRRK